MRKPDKDTMAPTKDGPCAATVHRNPSRPTGLMLSKDEKLACFVPDDLRVVLTAEAFEQLFGYVHATTSEISCMGSVRRDGNTFTVERFHLVQQEGGFASTEMDPAALGNLMEELLAQGRNQEARSLKCWAHSHPGMGCFWSKTDNDTCQRLVGDYLLSIVVSDGYAVRARLDVGTPLPFTVDQIPVILEVQPNKEAMKRYGQEVAEKVKERIAFSLEPKADPKHSHPVVDGEDWSEYFGAHNLFDEEYGEGVEALTDDFPFP